MGFASWVTKVGIRVGLVAGAVKLSLNQDVWTLNAAKGEKLYDEFTKNIVNGTIVYKSKIPPPEQIQTDLGSTWNKNVNCAFSWLNTAPEQLKDKVVSMYKTVV